jgi:predicted RNA binding protein with dsRBD fold (UPF0201 family)
MSQPEFQAEVIVEGTISPSEDPSKVASAICGVVGLEASTVQVGRDSARLRTWDPKVLTRVRDKLRDRHIRSTARRQLLLHRSGKSTSLMLNRQAAASGVLALCGTPEESPLGPFYLTMESDRLDEVIDWIAAYDEG